MLPYFKKSENQQHGASQFHGADGVLSVTDPLAPAVISHRFVEAAVALGYECNPDFNGAQQEGAGLYQLTIKDGKRHSTAAAFLVPILDRPNLTVTTSALVTRLLFEGMRTIGVEYLYEGTIHQTFVNQEFILSAGAFDSPKLLMLSGIGNAEHLRSLDIQSLICQVLVKTSKITLLSQLHTKLFRICNLPQLAISEKLDNVTWASSFS